MTLLVYILWMTPLFTLWVTLNRLVFTPRVTKTLLLRPVYRTGLRVVVMVLQRRLRRPTPLGWRPRRGKRRKEERALQFQTPKPRLLQPVGLKSSGTPTPTSSSAPGPRRLGPS